MEFGLIKFYHKKKKYAIIEDLECNTHLIFKNSFINDVVNLPKMTGNFIGFDTIEDKVVCYVIRLDDLPELFKRINYKFHKILSNNQKIGEVVFQQLFKFENRIKVVNAIQDLYTTIAINLDSSQKLSFFKTIEEFVNKDKSNRRMIFLDFIENNRDDIMIHKSYFILIWYNRFTYLKDMSFLAENIMCIPEEFKNEIFPGLIKRIHDKNNIDFFLNKFISNLDYNKLEHNDILHIIQILKSLSLEKRDIYANILINNSPDNLKIFFFKNFNINILNSDFLTSYILTLKSINHFSEIEFIFSKIDQLQKEKILKSIIHSIENELSESLFLIFSILNSTEIDSETKNVFFKSLLKKFKNDDLNKIGKLFLEYQNSHRYMDCLKYFLTDLEDRLENPLSVNDLKILKTILNNY